MTIKTKISAELAQLADFAAREDWLYQAELHLADEFSRAAQTFRLNHPGTEAICQHYIGPTSVLVYSARSSMFQAIRTIARSIDRLHGRGQTYQADDDRSNYLADPNPAQSFFRAEVAKRQLQTFGD